MGAIRSFKRGMELRNGLPNARMRRLTKARADAKAAAEVTQEEIRRGTKRQMQSTVPAAPPVRRSHLARIKQFFNRKVF